MNGCGARTRNCGDKPAGSRTIAAYSPSSKPKFVHESTTTNLVLLPVPSRRWLTLLAVVERAGLQGAKRFGTWPRTGQRRGSNGAGDGGGGTSATSLAGSSDGWFHHDADRACERARHHVALRRRGRRARRKAADALTLLCRSRSPADEPKRIERKRAAVQSLLDGFKIGNVEVRRRLPAVVYQVAGLEFRQASFDRHSPRGGRRRRRATAASGGSGAGCGIERSGRRCATGRGRSPPRETGDRARRVRTRAARAAAVEGRHDTKRGSTYAQQGATALRRRDSRPDRRGAQDDSPDVRTPAFYCLVHIGPKTAPALKEAIAKATDKARRGYLELCLQAVTGQT